MDEDKKAVVDASDTTKQEADAQDASVADNGEGSGETLEQINARLAKAEELASNYKVRAEKAEGKLKGIGTKGDSQKAESKHDLSTSDIYSLMRANVPEDDIAEVSEYARFKGISVAEALNSSVIKSTLAERAEKRNAANATSTGPARRGTAKASDEQLLEKASKGIMPESDDDLVRLIRLQKGIK